MGELRQSGRQRVFKLGAIAFEHASVITCRIRNLSGRGACLEVPSLLGIPDEFTLINETDKTKTPCRIAWRKGDRIGVTFK
jgi:hypothetical protein